MCEPDYEDPCLVDAEQEAAQELIERRRIRRNLFLDPRDPDYDDGVKVN